MVRTSNLSRVLFNSGVTVKERIIKIITDATSTADKKKKIRTGRELEETSASVRRALQGKSRQN